MRFLIDEDLSTDIARIGRRIGLDVISVHETDHEGWTDEEQLVDAAREGRCIVTGNGRDFEYLTNTFSVDGRPHAGVLIDSRVLRSAHPVAVARAPQAFDVERGVLPMDYVCIYLRPAP
jgi:predicted nuclease of predicted toxin-antitoxin system